MSSHGQGASRHPPRDRAAIRRAICRPSAIASRAPPSNGGARTFSREALKPVLHRLGQRTSEDAIAAVGRGELSSLDVLRAVFPDHQDERVTVKPSADDGWFNMRSAAGMISSCLSGSKEMAGRRAGGGAGSPADPWPLRPNAEVHFQSCRRRSRAIASSASWTRTKASPSIDPVADPAEVR